MSTSTAQEHTFQVRTKIALSEDFKATDAPQMKSLQILKTGNFADPRYGKFKITAKQFAEMIKNFEAGVRGIVPALDYGHETEGKAAGWLKKLYTKEVGKETQLWGDFELTPGGQKSLADKDYAYLSADFDDKYKDNEEGKTYGSVLMGAALTNRPVIKNMNPAIQLKEGDLKMADEQLSEETKKKLADHEKMCADMKKFADDMGEADPIEAMKKAVAAKGPAKPADEKPKDDAAPPADEAKKMSELSSRLEKIEKENKELSEKLAETGKAGEFTKLLSEGKAVEAQRASFMKGDMIEFAKAAQHVHTQETGHGGSPKELKFGEASVKLSEMAKKRSEEKKISLVSAQIEVMKENKELAEQYRKEMEG